MKNILKSNIAVLLAAYNGEKWIGQQIESILSQKNVRVHLYISVDLSTDNTVDILNELAKKHSEIYVLPYGQKFGSAAKNFYHLLLNVPTEQYDYVALSDQDDIWREDKLFNAVYMLKNNNADGYSSNLIAIWENGRKKITKKSIKQKKYDFLFETPSAGCTFVLKRDLVSNLKGYITDKKEGVEELEVHDWFIYAYARSRGYVWIIDKNAYIYYRQHENNQVGVNSGIRAFIYRVRLMLSGYGIDQAIKTIQYLDLKNDLFVSKWYKNNKIKYGILVFYSYWCRRNVKDQMYFSIMCLLLFIKNISR